MKTLLVLRHAKSSWKDPDLADYDRPLNKRGKKDAERMGSLLRKQDLMPQLILSSSAERAMQTAKRVAKESEFNGVLTVSRDLYAFGCVAYLEALSEVSDEITCVMIVGHNPGLEELVETFVGQYERLPTASLAQISIPIDHWSQISVISGAEITDEPDAELTNLWLPKQLK